MTKANDWLRQAKKDLEHAQKSLEIEHYEWSVLAAQQSAEKAVKAVFFQMGEDPWGHSILKFLKKLAEILNVEERLLNAAKNLDKHYVTARYPNGFASGAPEDYYTKEDAEEAIEDGKTILEFCENTISSLKE